ncbi:hypothetical protein D9757_007227 [Collybiopsis confluens]|uniref:Uncharacterized protein n=1 Tax=Collybiopsis confluens TaxID=2823264 RepID=A0A8H5HAF8_9AGAR|nr:hypothetical protein D9757_007227 [Collybiopsis confluens]
MMHKQTILLLFTFLFLGLFTSAAPIPVQKKALKQLKLKRGDPQHFGKRDSSPKPSGVVRRDDPSASKPSMVVKRDDPSSPQPSKSYKKA